MQGVIRKMSYEKFNAKEKLATKLLPLMEQLIEIAAAHKIPLVIISQHGTVACPDDENGTTSGYMMCGHTPEDRTGDAIYRVIDLMSNGDFARTPENVDWADSLEEATVKVSEALRKTHSGTDTEH